MEIETEIKKELSIIIKRESFSGDIMPLGFIFIDMDETLGFFRNYDGSIDSEGFASGIYLRQGIKPILEKLKKDFLLFITTAATVSYTKVVLEHSNLAKYFHGIYTRTDFVILENKGDANKEASPGGYEKRYSLIMKHFGIKMDQSKFGLVIGDNDYDTSCDVPGLKTLIVDSLFIKADTIYSIILDIFHKKDLHNYEDIGIRVFKKTQKHPLGDLESDNIELECLHTFKPVELEQVSVELTDAEKKDMKVTLEEQKESIDGIQALELEPDSVENLGKKLSHRTDKSENLDVENKEKEFKNEKLSSNSKKIKIDKKKRENIVIKKRKKRFKIF